MHHYVPCNFILNGELYLLNLSSVSLKNLHTYFLVPQTSTIVEHNLKILVDDKCNSVQINHFDKIEFITLVGGG